MLIGLNGRLKAGKDTTFLIIKEVLKEKNDPTPVIQVSFAEKLKASAAASLGIDRMMMEDLKAREDLYMGLLTAEPGILLTGPHLNMREYLQRYGTEAHRDIFGENFWVDQALPADLDHSTGLYVVTDMRFPNEIQRVKDLGGVTVKVVRDVETSHGDHPSEQNVDDQIDYFLNNTGTLEDLRTRVIGMLMDVSILIGHRNVGLPDPNFVTAEEAESIRGWRD
jgi:hypothetical protein